MRQFLVLFLCASAGSACDRESKLGVAGATCRATSDCSADLQCADSICADAAEIATAQQKRAAALVACDAEQLAAQAALQAELQALQAEQKVLAEQKDQLETSLKAISKRVEEQALGKKP